MIFLQKRARLETGSSPAVESIPSSSNAMPMEVEVVSDVANGSANKPTESRDGLQLGIPSLKPMVESNCMCIQ